MRILAIITGEYGQRHVENIQKNGPTHWQILTWKAPTALPLVIDYPEDYLPNELPEVDLIASFAEHKGVTELLPDIARMTHARSVLAPVDNEAWLPRGLARQLREWLAKMGIPCATPKPLCSLTEEDYGVTRRQRLRYEDRWIAEFARYFGQPDLRLEIDPKTRMITGATVQRDAVCGCARYVAERLVGVSIDEAELTAGLAHHHYPCLASMGKDPDFGDTLMHVSGNVLKDNITEQLKPYRQYWQPGRSAQSKEESGE